VAFKALWDLFSVLGLRVEFFSDRLHDGSVLELSDPFEERLLVFDPLFELRGPVSELIVPDFTICRDSLGWCTTQWLHY
jgi:hypothetical protein